MVRRKTLPELFEALELNKGVLRQYKLDWIGRRKTQTYYLCLESYEKKIKESIKEFQNWGKEDFVRVVGNCYVTHNQVQIIKTFTIYYPDLDKDEIELLLKEDVGEVLVWKMVRMKTREPEISSK